MEENTTTEMSSTSPMGRLAIFRPLWWILQGIIIGIWKFLLGFVLLWQLLHVLFTGEPHAWSKEFTRKFINQVVVWTEYTFWVRNERPEIVEY